MICTGTNILILKPTPNKGVKCLKNYTKNLKNRLVRKGLRVRLEIDISTAHLQR